MLRLGSPILLRSAPRLSLVLRAHSTNALTKNQYPFTYSSNGPSVVKYTNQHEWIAFHEDGNAFLGITKYAADALGDATYIELPELESEFENGESIGSVESVKSASEIYSPLECVVSEVNERLNDSPQLINSDPMGEGFICRVELKDPSKIEDNEELMSLSQYEEFLKKDH